jgi:hypothetical protein
MQASVEEWRSIQSMERWEAGEALEKWRRKRSERQQKTRRHCLWCNCVLYVRSCQDLVENENDLDEVFLVMGKGVECFRCYNGLPKLRWTGELLRKHRMSDRYSCNEWPFFSPVYTLLDK